VTAGLGSVFPAGAYEVRSGSNGTDEPWWLAAPALLQQVEQREYISRGTAAYGFGDAVLQMDADDRMLLDAFPLLYGDCAVETSVEPNGPRVRCTMRRSIEPPLVVLTFHEGAPSDLAGAGYHLLRPTCAVPPFQVGDSPLPGWRLTGGITGPVLAACGAQVLLRRTLVPVEFLVEYLVGIALASQPWMLPIHGASLRIGTAGAVVVGASRAGKTTTALYLAARGHMLLGEEIALVELTTRELVPFRRAVNVRPGRYGQELTAMLDLPDPVEDASARWWDGRHRISDLFPGPPAARAPLRAVFFLAGFADHAAIEPFQVTLDQRDVFSWITTPEIAYCSWGLDPARRALRLMVLKNVLSQVPCWLLTAGPPRETVELIERTMEEL